MSEENYNEILQNEQVNEENISSTDTNNLNDNENKSEKYNPTEARNDGNARQSRIKRIKNIIIYSLMLLIILPIVLCVVCFAKINMLESEVIAIKEQINLLIETQKESQNVEEIVENEANLATPSENVVAEKTEQVEQNVETIKKKNICLTFDDGPSVNTDAILDVLDKYNVKATFFVIGKKGFDEAYKRMAEDGHTLGMHSYSHKYDVIYKDLAAFIDDVDNIQTYIKEITGEECKYYRFPGGSSNTVSKVDMQYCIAYLEQEGIDYVDWNISSEDAAGATTVTELVDNVIGQIENSKADTLVVLMHDSKDKIATVEALPIIIEKINEMDDVEIVPISEDVNLVQHVVLDEETKEALIEEMNRELQKNQGLNKEAVSEN